MASKILTTNQKKFLVFFQKTLQLVKNFYFTGGTCLSEFYLQHRISEDLDFFSKKEFLSSDISVLLQKAKSSLPYKKIDYQQSFNRNIYQLILPKNDFLKIEFTFFPFDQIEKPKIVNGMRVDSLKDIAVNKVFTIFQNPRGRDYYDIFFIIKKTNWDLENLIKLARIKFDFQIDYLQLGTNLIKVKKLMDDPILKKDKVDFNKIEDFFTKQARLLKKRIIK